MATSQIRAAVDYLRLLRSDRDGLSDAQLLEAFIERRGQWAFHALLERHGPMVMGVCRRILRHHHDAEDAFQATFLVLARKAASVVPRRMLANWLYGVACRTAMKANSGACRRRLRERQVIDMPELEAADDDLWNELEPVIDRELSKLADKYRAPLVLCDLQGKTRKEAARHLRIAEGTLSSRLSKARGLLASRLARHGYAVPIASLLLLLGATSMAVPSTILSSTAKAATLSTSGAAITGLISSKAAALTEGVLKAMFLAKLKIVPGLIAGALCLLLAVQGLFWCAQSSARTEAPSFSISTAEENADPFLGADLGDKKEPPPPPMKGDPDGKDAPAKGEPKKDEAGKTKGKGEPKAEPGKTEPVKVEPGGKTELEGVWERITAVRHGEKLEVPKGTILTIKGDRFELVSGNKRVTVGTFTINRDKELKEIDVTYSEGDFTGKVIRGIYQLDGDQLQFRGPGTVDDERPMNFVTGEQSRGFFSVYRRKK
jgi:RNA polymerase sigma factor (sigma-70 family)